jgi:hypothetical protein
MSTTSPLASPADARLGRHVRPLADVLRDSVERASHLASAAEAVTARAATRQFGEGDLWDIAERLELLSQLADDHLASLMALRDGMLDLTTDLEDVDGDLPEAEDSESEAA